jgi:hypothetical protein
MVPGQAESRIRGGYAPAMPSRRLIAAVPLTLVLALPGAAQAQGIVPGESKLRHNGIGKVFTGMTIKKARKAAGIPLKRSRVGDCVYLSATPGSPDGPDLRFVGGKLRSVSVGRDGYATKRGVEVGDRARKVRRLYKRLTSRPNLGGGRDLVFKRGRHRLIFSVAQGRVYRISGGRAPWALWQECV